MSAAQFKRRLEGASIWVIFFGIFVGVSLFLQCMIPFISKFLMSNGHAYLFSWMAFINENFHLPMEVISNFWAAISAAYIGVDRAAMTISTINGEYNKMDSGNPEHNRHIIIQSFIIYCIAVVLSMLFDADLSLPPLAISFCASVLLYVSGQKAIYAASKIAPEDDANENGIPDDVEEKLAELIKDKKKILIATYQPNGKLKKEIEL